MQLVVPMQELSQRLSKFISIAEASEQTAEQAFAISFKVRQAVLAYIWQECTQSYVVYSLHCALGLFGFATCWQHRVYTQLLQDFTPKR